MKRVALVLALVLAACGTNASSGSHTRQVLVDDSPDDLVTSVFGYFPRFVEAHPGDTIDFHQTWTGEPHTITLGTLTKPLGEKIKPLFLKHKELPDYLDTSEYGLPTVWPPEDTATPTINQTAAQPCYVKSGPIPDKGVGCPKVQPAFDGTQEFYNSGYIPYQGNKRDEFHVPLASSIKPGEYFYYCLLHGPGMGGFIDVKPKGATLASAKGLHDPDLVAGIAAARKARTQAATKKFRLPGTDIQAGTFSYYVDTKPAPVSVNEFLPATFRAKVGQKVTWSFINGPGHTVSFDVPPYLPVIEFRKDGTVALNEKANSPQGGPGYPHSEGEPPEDGYAVDVGDYDGTHFLSSGFPDGPMRYSITFTKPGTYPYACLIHPLMLGKIVVSA
jgi:plastocyanin